MKSAIAYNIGVLYAIINDFDNSILWLEIPLKDDSLLWIDKIQKDPDLKIIKEDKKFIEFIQKFGGAH